MVELKSCLSGGRGTTPDAVVAEEPPTTGPPRHDRRRGRRRRRGRPCSNLSSSLPSSLASFSLVLVAVASLTAALAEARTSIIRPNGHLRGRLWFHRRQLQEWEDDDDDDDGGLLAAAAAVEEEEGPASAVAGAVVSPPVNEEMNASKPAVEEIAHDEGGGDGDGDGKANEESTNQSLVMEGSTSGQDLDDTGDDNGGNDDDAFCGECLWKNEDFDCDYRVAYMQKSYYMSEEQAKGALLEEGDCHKPLDESSHNNGDGSSSNDSENDAPSFPEGCSWECYLANYPDLSTNLPHTEEAALDHYLNQGGDCGCKEAANETPAAGGEPQPSEGNVISELEKVEEQMLDGQNGDLTEEQLEDLQELEGTLIEKAAKEEVSLGGDGFDTDDEYGESEPIGGVEDLEEEIEELEEDIEAIQVQDDGGYADDKEEKIYDLMEEEQELKDQLQEETIIENELAGFSNSTIVESMLGDIIDPTLTMDLTTLNPPGMDGLSISTEAKEASSSGEGTGTAVVAPTEDEESGTTKESQSPPSNMDAGPSRTNATATTSVAVLAGTAKEAESEVETIDTEAERTDNDATSKAANGTYAASPPVDVGEQTGVNGEAQGETTGDNAEDGGDDAEAPSSPSPTPKVTAAASSTTETSSPPTVVSPAENVSTTTASTSPPTVEYVEPADSLDPVANEELEKEGFEDGEAIPPGGEESGSTSSTTADDVYREEEEVKKVGGWLSVTSIILMIYTAYQMSENPDGICASLCRLVITVIGCMIKIALIPCKYIVGGRPSGGHYMATPDYRDPYGSRHMELT